MAGTIILSGPRGYLTDPNNTPGDLSDDVFEGGTSIVYDGTTPPVTPSLRDTSNPEGFKQMLYLLLASIVLLLLIITRVVRWVV